MVQLGIHNSRMKDVLRRGALARDFDFDGRKLIRALRATFERRRSDQTSAAASI
jgi:hypothetical protein